jgi:hypothetical protein
LSPYRRFISRILNASSSSIMIEATQVRIGNIFEVQNRQIIVSAIQNGVVSFKTLSGNGQCGLHQLEPIRLSPEVVLEFGFEKAGPKYVFERYFLEPSPGIALGRKDQLWWHFGVNRNFDGEKFYLCTISYLHELQNIFSSLAKSREPHST